MNTVPFDTLKFAKRMAEAGFTKKQAEALAEEQSSLIENELATKKDLYALEANLKRDIRELEMRLTIRLGGMLVTGIAIVAALVKLL